MKLIQIEVAGQVRPVRHHLLLGWGSAVVAIAAGDTDPIPFSVTEGGTGGRFIAPEIDAVVTDIKHGSVSLVSGFVPIALFARYSLCNPRMYRKIEKGDTQLKVYVNNTSNATLNLSFALAAPPLAGELDDYEGDASRPGTRQLIAAGGDSATDIAATLSNQFTIELSEPMNAAYLVIGCADPAMLDDQLVVTEFKVGNKELLDSGSEVPASMFACDNPDNPLLGFSLDTTDDVVVTVKNIHATVAVESVAVCITSG